MEFAQKANKIKHFWWRRGELNRRLASGTTTEKVLDSAAKSRPFSDFPEDEGDPKTASKGPDNPEKPDRVRSTKGMPQFAQ